ncbi:MAG: MFS transporter, partial [Gemmatimonadota bacterium]
AAVVLGLGTAAVYPTLIAQVSDLVTPRDRASGVGIYRLWRDLGYVAGGLFSGLLADLLGFRAAIGLVALLTAGSGALVSISVPNAAAAADGDRFTAAPDGTASRST